MESHSDLFITISHSFGAFFWYWSKFLSSEKHQSTPTALYFNLFSKRFEWIEWVSNHIWHKINPPYSLRFLPDVRMDNYSDGAIWDFEALCNSYDWRFGDFADYFLNILYNEFMRSYGTITQCMHFAFSFWCWIQQATSNSSQTLTTMNLAISRKRAISVSWCYIFEASDTVCFHRPNQRVVVWYYLSEK